MVKEAVIADMRPEQPSPAMVRRPMTKNQKRLAAAASDAGVWARRHLDAHNCRDKSTVPLQEAARELANALYLFRQRCGRVYGTLDMALFAAAIVYERGHDYVLDFWLR